VASGEEINPLLAAKRNQSLLVLAPWMKSLFFICFSFFAALLREERRSSSVTAFDD